MGTVPEEQQETAVVEAYGARLAITAPNAEVLRTILAGLPRGWSVCEDDVAQETVSWRLAVIRDGDGYQVRDGQGHDRHCADIELATWMLRTQMRRFVGYHATDLIFVHAGVVAWEGRAIVLPGHSFAGKSTLVEALVRAGATFYSDEYAMLDPQGRVAHYREPLSLRSPTGRQHLDLDSGSARECAPVGLVAFAVYKPGSSWSPMRLTTGEGVVEMMAHSIPARDRPAETLATLRLALDHAEILRGDRGEADETARLLLQSLATADT